jgi:hypothetical protein
MRTGFQGHGARMNLDYNALYCTVGHETTLAVTRIAQDDIAPDFATLTTRTPMARHL